MLRKMHQPPLVYSTSIQGVFHFIKKFQLLHVHLKVLVLTCKPKRSVHTEGYHIGGKMPRYVYIAEVRELLGY